MTSRGDGPRRGREAALGHVSPAGACPPATAAAALPTVPFRRDFRKRTRSFFNKERRLATRTAPPTGRSRPQPAQHRGPVPARSSRVTFLPASVPNTLSPAKGPSLVAVVTTSLGASPSHSSLLRNSARRSPLSRNTRPGKPPSASSRRSARPPRSVKARLCCRLCCEAAAGKPAPGRPVGRTGDRGAAAAVTAAGAHGREGRTSGWLRRAAGECLQPR